MKNIGILLVSILALCAGLFFFVSLESDAYESKAVYSEKISREVVDPLEKIGGNSLDFGDTSSKKCSSADIFPEENKKEENKDDIAHKNILNLVGGYPIEAMAAKISREERTVAAFLIGIAKKESDWGKHSPKKDGRDCYNYWGYKGGYNLTASGYSCFDSPEQAVEMVGGRISELVDKKINTPERMVVWKCGSSCAGHDPGGVRKWISDVSSYFYKLNS